MKLNQIPISELELLPYTTIAKMYLEENKTTKIQQIYLEKYVTYYNYQMMNM